jgi:hypothetical protein
MSIYDSCDQFVYHSTQNSYQGGKSETSGVRTSSLLHDTSVVLHGTSVVLHGTSVVLHGTSQYFTVLQKSIEVDEVSLFPPWKSCIYCLRTTGRCCDFFIVVSLVSLLISKSFSTLKHCDSFRIELSEAHRADALLVSH